MNTESNNATPNDSNEPAATDAAPVKTGVGFWGVTLRVAGVAGLIGGGFLLARVIGTEKTVAVTTETANALLG